MPLPIPCKSSAAHFYKYSSPAHLEWLKDILHRHEIYLPTLAELNDDNDGFEEETADFLWDRFEQIQARHHTNLQKKKKLFVTTFASTVLPRFIRTSFRFWTAI